MFRQLNFILMLPYLKRLQAQLSRDGEVTHEKELSYNYSEELGNFSYFIYSYQYKELAQDVT